MDWGTAAGKLASGSLSPSGPVMAYPRKNGYSWRATTFHDYSFSVGHTLATMFLKMKIKTFVTRAPSK